MLSDIKAHTEDLPTCDLPAYAPAYAVNDNVHESMQAALDVVEIGLKRVSSIVHNMSIAHEGFYSIKQSSDINQCIKTASNLLTKKLSPSVDLTFELDKLPRVFVDNYKISQLMLNLLTNAAAAVSDKGEIVICSQQQAGQILVSVSDNGCGIDERLQGQIFNPCYTTSNNVEGTGLGLAISKDIAVEHGASITVKSKKGEGSTFTLTLPISDILVH